MVFRRTATTYNARRGKWLDVEMVIDVDEGKLAAYFARKLATSKGDKSKIQDGAVTARRVRVTARG